MNKSDRDKIISKIKNPRTAYFAACKALGLDEDARHAMNMNIIGKASTTAFNATDWRKMQAHLNSKTGQSGHSSQTPNEWAWVDSAAPNRQPQLRKLIMLAKSAGIARGGQIAYIEGIAKQAAGLKGASAHKPLRMCDAAELRILVQALSVYVKRQKKAAL
jgi:hypothetical protein